ncbi:serine/threonine/tyrosine-interacting-like protein 1 [Nematolebias whitei]|uniref:serine/threonine/tyrosine-interacting-like protein 1 n=1 Tax=Nematolebias whitei TaxID=451745 RepID=UPI00189A5485|nr:serine/threonine/tyrosine-interacting-like protein 1 [Nematolebias whitei]
MAEIIMCNPFELYNLLNQFHRVSRLAEINYLWLVDARELQDYYTSHIVTAKCMKMESDGKCIFPEDVEADSMQRIVVYDSNTSCLWEKGRAMHCAQALAKFSLYPVHILKGGFRRFAALYPFLMTKKILYTITELENVPIYPVEIVAGLLYMGDQKQSQDTDILKDLTISAVVNLSHFTQNDSLESVVGNQTILNIPVTDSVESDLYSNFQPICRFINSHIRVRSRVLIVSRQGRSRSSAVAIAFLMQHFKYSLEEAWRYMLKCKSSMRPNTGFLQQLSDWELHITGVKQADLSKTPFN